MTSHRRKWKAQKGYATKIITKRKRKKFLKVYVYKVHHKHIIFVRAKNVTGVENWSADSKQIYEENN